MNKAKITVLIRENGMSNVSVMTTAECAKQAFDDWSSGYDHEIEAPPPYITITGVEGEVLRIDCSDVQAVIVAEDQQVPQVLTPSAPGLIVPKNMQN